MKLLKHYNHIFFVIFGLLFLHGIILFLMGQPLIYKGGFVKLWHGVVQSAENSQHMFDWYTFSHLIHGFLFFWILSLFKTKLSPVQRLCLAMGIEMGWEIIENTHFVIDRYREATIALDYYGDSVINSVCDLLAATTGYVLASQMRWQVVLGLLFLMELVVGYMIHDNLTLNVLMLLYPIDAVKEWQGVV